MIRAEKLSYSVPAKDLYNKVSFSIEENQHAVLIGSNDLAFEHNRLVFLSNVYVHRISHGRVGRLTPFNHIEIVKRGDNIVIFRVARNDPHVIKARGHFPAFFFCAELVQPYAVVFEIAWSGNAPFASCELGCKGGKG